MVLCSMSDHRVKDKKSFRLSPTHGRRPTNSPPQLTTLIPHDVGLLSVFFHAHTSGTRHAVTLFRWEYYNSSQTTYMLVTWLRFCELFGDRGLFLHHPTPTLPMDDMLCWVRRQTEAWRTRLIRRLVTQVPRKKRMDKKLSVAESRGDNASVATCYIFSLPPHGQNRIPRKSRREKNTGSRKITS
jgi:hypothetical protein